MLFKLKPKYNLMKKTCVKTKQTKQTNKKINSKHVIIINNITVLFIYFNDLEFLLQTYQRI